MKKLFVAAMMLMGAWSASVNAQYTIDNEVMYNVEASSLSRYLNLNKYQAKDVEKISQAFIEAQKSSTTVEELEAAVKKNLFQMSRVLVDYDKYSKYRALLNATANNKKQYFNYDTDIYYTMR